MSDLCSRSHSMLMFNVYANLWLFLMFTICFECSQHWLAAHYPGLSDIWSWICFQTERSFHILLATQHGTHPNVLDFFFVCVSVTVWRNKKATSCHSSCKKVLHQMLFYILTLDYVLITPSCDAARATIWKVSGFTGLVSVGSAIQLRKKSWKWILKNSKNESSCSDYSISMIFPAKYPICDHYPYSVFSFLSGMEYLGFFELFCYDTSYCEWTEMKTL